MERYDGIPGTDLDALFSSPNYPGSPSISMELSSFEVPTNIGDDYGARLRGYLCAPETGTYYFWIAGDDEVQLLLSTDNQEGNTSLVAYHEGWTSSRQWGKYSTQKSIGIDMTMGQTYYIEALLKENKFGDNMAVGWRKPSDGDGSVPVEVIPGSALSPYVVNPISVSGVVLSPTSASVEENDILQLTHVISPSNADDLGVSWSSSNANVAIVDQNGQVTGIAIGTATITVVTDDGGYTDQATVTVTEDVPTMVTGVSVTP